MELSDKDAELFLFFMQHHDEIERLVSLGLVAAQIKRASVKSSGAVAPLAKRDAPEG